MAGHNANTYQVLEFKRICCLRILAGNKRFCKYFASKVGKFKKGREIQTVIAVFLQTFSHLVIECKAAMMVMQTGNTHQCQG